MNRMGLILVVAAATMDADLIRRLLSEEFDEVTTADADQAAEVFDRQPPRVLVLAFRPMERAQGFGLALYRRSRLIHGHPHRVVVLCAAEETLRAYQLCRQECFDDYVVFWPFNHDAPRLRMAVHHALRELDLASPDMPDARAFATQARRVADLERALAGYEEQGRRHLDEADRRLLGAGSAAELVGEVIAPVRRWAGAMAEALAPQVESARALAALAARVRPLVLLVDDDDMQHALVARMLAGQNIDLIGARSCQEAWGHLRERQPDLVLMDINLPDTDGIEMTRRIRSAPRLSDLPVIMLTGHSGKRMVVDSLAAGAADFVVKPFTRDGLLGKIERFLADARTA